jgi:hypothetical protein
VVGHCLLIPERRFIMPFVRRTFLATTAATLGAGNSQAAVGPRKRIAFLATEMRVLSHAQQFLDRFAMGYAWRGCW